MVREVLAPFREPVARSRPKVPGTYGDRILSRRSGTARICRSCFPAQAPVLCPGPGPGPRPGPGPGPWPWPPGPLALAPWPPGPGPGPGPGPWPWPLALALAPAPRPRPRPPAPALPGGPASAALPDDATWPALPARPGQPRDEEAGATCRTRELASPCLLVVGYGNLGTYSPQCRHDPVPVVRPGLRAAQPRRPNPAIRPALWPVTGHSPAVRDVARPDPLCAQSCGATQ